MNRNLKKLIAGVVIASLGACAGIYWYQRTDLLSAHESFFNRFINNPSQVGAIAESSEGLAKAITTYAQHPRKENRGQGRNFLEVGAGTGVFTQHLINKMGAFDSLDIVEYDSIFYTMLKKRFGTIPSVNIYQCSIADFVPDKQYDFIVSGLPFNAFPAELVEKILNVYKKALKPDGTFAYFEYIALPTFKRLGLSVGALFSDTLKKEKNDFDQTLKLVQAFRKNFELVEEHAIFLNLPPARAFTCHPKA